MGRDNLMLKKAYLEISNACNLSCRFCPGTKREARIMTPAEFHVLAERLRKHTEYLYLHLMGEPLLHPQLEELLGIAAELGFRVIITTNGTLLPERGALLLKSEAVHKVNISLQSFEGNGGDEPEDYLRACTDFAAAAGESGIPFDLIHCGGNFVMTLVLYKPLKKGMEYALHGKTKKTLPEEKPET